MSFFILSLLYIYKRYSIIHVHNMPDFLVFCTIIPHIFGAKVILDLHDPMPELFMAKYSMKKYNKFIQFLCLQEKHSIQFSNLVLTPNIAFRNLFVSRGCPKSKIHIVMNSPDEKVFSHLKKSEKNKKKNNNAFRVMFHGTIVKRNGLDVALKAISQIRQKIPNLIFQIYGRGEHLDPSRRLSIDLDINDVVNFHGHVSLERIAQDIQLADVGIIPNEPSIHWESAMPTRVFEYLCMGKPVIVPRTRGILDYFNEDSIFFHEPGNPESLADVIFEVYKNPKKRKFVLNRGMSIHEKYSWKVQRKYFLEIVKHLLEA